MTSKEIKAFFPLTIQVTDNHRKLAAERGGPHYIGNILLEESFPSELKEDIFWGLSLGMVKGVEIKTTTRVIHKGAPHIIAQYIDKNCTDTEIKFELR